ncbi:MAG: circadian clock protein KaiA [Elainellaceae cyanobacterium]
MASNQVSKPKIAVYAHPTTSALVSALERSLESNAYLLKVFLDQGEFVEAIEAYLDDIDCIILGDGEHIPHLLEELRSRSVLLPTILIKDKVSEKGADNLEASAYRIAVHWLESCEVDQLPARIDKAISQFLKIPSAEDIEQLPLPDIDEQERAVLVCQQRRLAEKLKERLGYLGVYYKRDPKRFIRYLPVEEREHLLSLLKQSYQEIVLNYFTEDPLLNQKIDNYVNSAFFADVPVVQIVEIHMDLMDAFSKQLKLEGRSEEILLDYRLTLIDTLSNLCEMYRRSIPRKT